MNVLWFEFMLSLRRLARRRTQNGLLLLTFAVSLWLSLLSWSLFHTIFLTRPEFDPDGNYYVLSNAGGLVVDGNQHSRDEIKAYKAEQGVFADFAEVVLYSGPTLTTPTGGQRYLAAHLSAHALQVIGARPLLGRLFTPAEDERGAPPAMLISQRLWENYYGRDPHIVGRVAQVNDSPTVIVGVMPADFRFPNDQELWLNYGSANDPPRYQTFQALVRLKPGVTRERAEQDLQMILARQGPNSPTVKKGLRPALLPLRAMYLQPEIRVSAVILMALSLIFVLVSCANAANLMLIDFLGRRPEVAASLALGVPRGAAIRAVCWQVGVIAAAAAVLGLGFLSLTGPAMYDRIKLLNAPYWLSYHFSWSFVGMAIALAGLSAVVTVIAPILYLWWVDPDQVIREHAYANRGSGRALWRRLLMTAQIALLTVLGVSAGLLVRSGYNVGEGQWGYPASQVFMGKMTNFFLWYHGDNIRPKRLEMHRRALEEVERRGTTAAAAFVENPPGYSQGPFCTYALDPGAFAQHAERGEAYFTQATENYFDVLSVPFVAGKAYPRKTSTGDPIYCVINASLAAKLWPGEDPLQRVLYTRYPNMKETDPPLRLVVCGVVRDFQVTGPTAKTNDGIFTPFEEVDAVPQVRPIWTQGVFLVVRDKGGVPDFRSLTDAVHRADSRIVLYFPSTIKGQIDLTLSSIRMTKDLTTVFAAAAVLLCAIGVYSLTVAQVLQSSREFGIRMALGAEPVRLWRDFSMGHLLGALMGVGLGLLGASQVMKVLGSLLYGVDPRSSPTYATVALAILFVATLACVPSLFRLKRINPADCLRSL
jgi:predicted permease